MYNIKLASYFWVIYLHYTICIIVQTPDKNIMIIYK